MSEFEKVETIQGIDKLLAQSGRSVADGLATSCKVSFPSGGSVEFYRDNVGMWYQKIVNGVVTFDSRGWAAAFTSSEMGVL